MRALKLDELHLFPLTTMNVADLLQNSPSEELTKRRQQQQQQQQQQAQQQAQQQQAHHHHPHHQPQPPQQQQQRHLPSPHGDRPEHRFPPQPPPHHRPPHPPHRSPQDFDRREPYPDYPSHPQAQQHSPSCVSSGDDLILSGPP